MLELFEISNCSRKSCCWAEKFFFCGTYFWNFARASRFGLAIYRLIALLEKFLPMACKQYVSLWRHREDLNKSCLALVTVTLLPLS